MSFIKDYLAQHKGINDLSRIKEGDLVDQTNERELTLPNQQQHTFWYREKLHHLLTRT